MSVDTKVNVITNISAEHASNKDSQILIKHSKKTIEHLRENKITCKTILADAGFSSGENYKHLEDQGIEAFIPLHGTYQTHRGEFKYDGRRKGFVCPNGQILKAKYTKSDHGRKQVAYTSSKKYATTVHFAILASIQKASKSLCQLSINHNMNECSND